MSRLVAVDLGSYRTKAAIKTDGGDYSIISIRTNVCKVTGNNHVGSGKQADGEGMYRVEYEGQNYVVGRQTNLTVNKADGNLTDLQRIVTYTALAMLVDDGAEIDCIVGYPIFEISSVEKRDQYREFFSNGGKQINITVDGTSKTFAIKEIRFVPTGYGVTKMFGHGRCLCGLVDIGKSVCHGMVYFDGFPVGEMAFEEELGYTALVEIAASKIGRASNNETAEGILLLDEFYKNPEEWRPIHEILRIAHESKKALANKIIAACKNACWPTNLMSVIFTGGGAEMMRLEIREVTDYIKRFQIPDNAFNVNVKGLIEYAERLNQDELSSHANQV